MPYIERQMASEAAKDTPPLAVAIFGPRRIGKTTMLERLAGPRQARWYTGDTVKAAKELDFQDQGDIKTALLQYGTVVIDEAHKIPNIGNIVKMLVDVNERLQTPAEIYLTSSSPLYLASIKESALGRVVSRQMWPLSLSELAQHTSWGNVMNNLSQYLVYGMMPNVFLEGDSAHARQFLTDYCEGLLLKDVLDLGQVRKVEKFRTLVQILAYSVGSEVNFDNLGKECGLSKNTVEEYIGQLERASIIRVCSSYSRNLANELKKGKKIYFFDNGIRNALIHDFSALGVRADAGALWENFFFMERVKLHDTRRDFTQIYFWRTTGPNTCEIDFIEVLDQQICAFECKLSDKVKKSKGAKQFLANYPGSTVQIVHPDDCLRIFGDLQTRPAVNRP